MKTDYYQRLKQFTLLKQAREWNFSLLRTAWNRHCNGYAPDSDSEEFQGAPCPAEGRSLFYRASFIWASPLIKLAKLRNLEPDDLPDLPPNMKPEEVHISSSL